MVFVAYQTKSYVDTHLRRKCHTEGKAYLAKQKAKKEAAAKHKDKEVLAMQRVTTLQQPTPDVLCAIILKASQCRMIWFLPCLHMASLWRSSTTHPDSSFTKVNQYQLISFEVGQ